MKKKIEREIKEHMNKIGLQAKLRWEQKILTLPKLGEKKRRLPKKV